MLGLDFDFEFVEAVAVYAADVSLSDEGVGVDVLDDAGDCDGLDFAAHHEEDFDGLFAVPARGVEDGASAVGVVDDGVGNLGPAAGDDGELYGAAVGVDYLVGDVGDEEEDDEAVDELVNLVEYEV